MCELDKRNGMDYLYDVNNRKKSNRNAAVIIHILDVDPCCRVCSSLQSSGSGLLGTSRNPIG